MEINLIVALGRHGEIGKNGELIWKISDDLKRFKKLTMGHPVIMGRKTWETLPKRPLPGRDNIIVTRSKDYKEEDAIVCHSIEEAIEMRSEDDPFIIGGAEVYRAALPFVTKLHLTLIDGTCDDADAWLKLDTTNGWNKVEESPEACTPEGIRYRYVTYERSFKG